MQPDLLSAQREKEQSESLSPVDTPQLDPQYTLPVTAVENAAEPQPVLPTMKKRSKFNFAALGLALLVFVLFLAIGWVGYWAYTLNTELTTTQGQLVALQSEHDKLQAGYTTLTSENEKLNTDLNQIKSELETANSALATAQADLDKAKDQNKSINAQLEQASGLSEILYVTTTLDEESDILKIDQLITESKNKELIKYWDAFANSPSDDAFGAFLDYLIFATRESLR